MILILLYSFIVITIGLIVSFWDGVKLRAKNIYTYLFLDDTKYYWTSIGNPVYVNNNKYPHHIITELRGYWKDGVYREIEPNLPFKKEMLQKFEDCKIYATIVNMKTRELSYENFIIKQGKLW